jgi:hypothetical protein
MGVVAILASLCSAVLAGAAAVGAVAPQRTDPHAVQVEVVRVPLDPGDPSRTAVGPLEFRGGLWLRADDPAFGGLSDLRVSEDGRRLTAVTDCGGGFTASLRYDDAGWLSGLEDARLTPLTGADGAPLPGDEIDAESLLALPDGGLVVGFEGRSRIQAYGPGFAGPARPEPAPEALAGCGHNGGLELMADVGNGRRLLVCEERRTASESVPAWIGGASEPWRERSYPLTFDGGWAAEPFRPTAAARLPNGDLLVLERRFPPLAARLVRIESRALSESGALAGAELARLEPPLTTDNYEGIDVRADGRGRTLVYLLSDDNNCAKVPGALRRSPQRTLLLLFVLRGEGSG